MQPKASLILSRWQNSKIILVISNSMKLRKPSSSKILGKNNPRNSGLQAIWEFKTLDFHQFDTSTNLWKEYIKMT